MRSSPEVSNDNVIDTLSYNASLALLSDSAGWLHAMNNKMEKGYLKADNVMEFRYAYRLDDLW